MSPELRAALHAEARAYLAAEQSTTPARDKAALLATPLLTPPPAVLDLETLLAYLPDLPSVLRAATHDEARATVAPVLSHVWVKDRELYAITPTLAFEPLLVGV